MLDAIVIGAGQSGLAVSYYLRKYGADFVVLDADLTVARVMRAGRWLGRVPPAGDPPR